MHGQKVVSLIVLNDGSAGLVVGFNDGGVADEYLDPFMTAHLIEEGGIIWYIDSNEHNIYGTPTDRVVLIICMDKRDAINAMVAAGSKDPTDGQNAAA
jgi:hypothetical protein